MNYLTKIKNLWSNITRSLKQQDNQKNRFVFTEGEGNTLTAQTEGYCGKIRDIQIDSPHRRRQLMILGALPGNKITIEQESPAYVVNIENMRFALDEELAGRIYVSNYS